MNINMVEKKNENTFIFLTDADISRYRHIVTSDG